jgi:Transglutaminase-like superfamily
MWEQLRRFSALDGNARWMFARVALLLPAVSLSLRIRGFRFTQSALQQLVSGTKRCATEQSQPFVANSAASASHRTQIAARMVRAAARRIPMKLTCLEESLALWFLLRREGIAAELRIGARKTGDKFEAHAWVECDGEALNQTEDPHTHYAVFDALGSTLAEAQ